MTQAQLKHRCTRVFPDVWIDKRVEMNFYLRSLAAGHWMKGDGVLCGFSAAALHGSKWIDDDRPAEIMTRRRWRKHADLHVWRQQPGADEVTEIAGFRVTTAARTAYDLARNLPLENAVIAVDAVANATKIDSTDILRILDNHPNHSRRHHVRAVAAAMDSGSESPPETITRLLIVDHGLPRPETQIIIRDDFHGFLARVDMGYRQWRVLVEYEGGDHGEDSQLESDVERYYMLGQLGWTVIRVTASLLRSPWGRR